LYSDADASSPGFTVTDSISIGRKGWHLETNTGTSDHKWTQNDSPHPPSCLPKSYPRWYSLGLMQTSWSSRLSRMPHGRHIKDERKEIRIWNLSLGGSSHQAGDAAFSPAMPQDLQHRLTQHATHESKNKINFALCKRTASPARKVLEDTSHQIRP
jgi:hypothetical protein